MENNVEIMSLRYVTTEKDRFIDLISHAHRFTNPSKTAVFIPMTTHWNSIGGDPAPGAPKKVYVEICHRGESVMYLLEEKMTKSLYISSQDDIDYQDTFDSRILNNLNCFSEFTQTLALLPLNRVHLDISMCDDTHRNALYYNTEQLSRKEWLHKTIQIRKRQHIIAPNIIDYSRANIRLAKEEDPSYDSLFLPIVFHPGFLFVSQKKQYDVGFIGTVTHRRRQILEKIREAGINVHLVESFSFRHKNWDLLKCKILLNIHAADDYQVFEFSRCSVPIFNGQIVVSEPSIYTQEETGTNAIVLSYVHFVPLDKIVSKLKEMIDDYDRYVYKPDLLRLMQQTVDDVKMFLEEIKLPAAR